MATPRPLLSGPSASAGAETAAATLSPGSTTAPATSTALPATATATTLPATFAPLPTATTGPLSAPPVVAPTFTPAATPTTAVPATTSAPAFSSGTAPVATPTITPGPNVPLQPVRRAGGTLNAGVIESDFKNRNYSPYAAGLNEVSRHLQQMVWNARLLYRDPVRLEWKPLAARSLPQADATGRRFTFNLREDLTWSDGSPITSADYIFAFNQALRPENRFPGLSQLQRITQLEGPNLRTLVFTLDDRYATALQIISMIEPLPARVWSRYPFSSPTANPELTRPTLTSGPFAPDFSGLNLVALGNYTQGRPNLQTIALRPVKNRAQLYDGLKAGQFDWSLHDLPSGAYNQFQNLNSVAVYRWYRQDAASRYIGYNLNNSFLQTRGVRQALNRLLDVRSLIATVENGLAASQPGFLPVSNEYALKTPNNTRFNIRLARDELKAAGFTPREEDNTLADADGRPVAPLELLYPDNSTEAETISAYIIQQYRQVGVAVKPVKLEPGALRQRLDEGKYGLELGQLYIAGAYDPDDYKAYFTSRGAFNYSSYSNSQVDTLFEEGVRILDTTAEQKAARRQVYERLQTLVADDSPLFFLYTLQAFTVMSSGLDPAGAGVINLPRWQLAWDAFPAYLNWYFKDAL